MTDDEKKQKRERIFNNLTEMEKAIEQLREADKSNKDLIQKLEAEIEKLKSQKDMDMSQEEEDFFDANRDE